MKGDDQDRQRSPLIAWLITAVVLSPFLYVLSFGPACWLGNNGYLADEAKIVYVPLALLAQYCPPLRDALQWYIDLFR